MSQLMGKLFCLSVLLLLLVGAAVSQEDDSASDTTDKVEKPRTFSEAEVNAIIDRAYSLGYRRGYEAGNSARIVEVPPDLIPNFPTEYPLSRTRSGGTRWVVPRQPNRFSPPSPGTGAPGGN